MRARVQSIQSANHPQVHYPFERLSQHVGALPPPDRARLAPVLTGLLAGQLEDAAAELQRRYNGEHRTLGKLSSDPWPGSINARPASPADAAAAAARTTTLPGPHVLGVSGPSAAELAQAPGSGGRQQGSRHRGSRGAGGPRGPQPQPQSASGTEQVVSLADSKPVETRGQLDRIVRATLCELQVGR